jgi:hypothetical protein
LRIYRLLFWSTLFYDVALFIRAFEPVTQFEPVSDSYGAQCYKMGFRTWLYNSAAMTALLTNLAGSFDRYTLITNKCQCCCTKMPVLALVGIFLVFSLACFCFHTYFVVHHQLAKTGESYFSLDYTSFGKTIGPDVIRIFMFGFRDCVLWFAFVIINVLLIFETKRCMQKKAILVVKRNN